MTQKLIYVCEGGDCTERGSGDVFERLRELLAEHDPEEQRFRVRRYPCFGACEVGINASVYPDRVFYSHLQVSDLPEVVQHLVDGDRPVERLTGKAQPDVEEMVWTMLDSPY